MLDILLTAFHTLSQSFQRTHVAIFVFCFFIDKTVVSQFMSIEARIPSQVFVLFLLPYAITLANSVLDTFLYGKETLIICP